MFIYSCVVGKALEKELAEKQKLLKEKDIEIEKITSAHASLEQSFQDRISKITSNHQKRVGELEERLNEKDNELENERKQSMDIMTLQVAKTWLPSIIMLLVYIRVIELHSLVVICTNTANYNDLMVVVFVVKSPYKNRRVDSHVSD